MCNVFAFPREFMKSIQKFKLGFKKILLSLKKTTYYFELLKSKIRRNEEIDSQNCQSMVHTRNWYPSSNVSIQSTCL